MLAEWRGLEYVMEVLRVLHKNPGIHDSRSIQAFIAADNRIQSTLSYLQKILPRMAKIGLVQSSGDGYTLFKPIDEIMVDHVLEFGVVTEPDSPLNYLCQQIKAAVSLSSIDEFYDFT